MPDPIVSPEAAQAAQEAVKGMSLGDTMGLSLLGFSIVFVVLVILMVAIRVMRIVLERASDTSASAPAPAAVVAAPSTPAAPAKDPNKVPAKGSFGDVRLHSVDDKSAALIMAIVADELKAPLNELRFLSIREKK